MHSRTPVKRLTRPQLPAFIPTTRTHPRHKLTALQLQRRKERRKETIELLILFAFFTVFFALFTIAAFS